MCSNCLPYRDRAGSGECRSCEDAGGSTSESRLDSFQTPISRGQLLRVVGGGIGAALTAGALNWLPARAAGNSLPYVVLIVLDGGRPDYFNVPGIPHIRSLIRNGTEYTNAFAGILESETPSGHASITTGSEPRKTGIPSFWWARNNVSISLFNETKIRAGDMEKIIRDSRLPTIAGQIHSRAPRAKVVALSASKYYAADAIGGPEADMTMYFQVTPNGQFAPTYIPGHAAPSKVLNGRELAVAAKNRPLGADNHLAMKLATKAFQETRQQVTMINLPEFDWPLGHINGAIWDPQAVHTLMQGFDRDLAMLQNAYRKAGVLDRTLFVLMADHGMMPLRHKISEPDIRNAAVKAGTALVAQAYSSGAYLWVENATRAGLVAQNIVKLNNPYIQAVYVRAKAKKGYAYSRVSSDKLLRTNGTEAANQYLLNSFNGSNAPDVVAVFTEGVGCEPGGQSQWKGDHGGSSWRSQHIPLILSGPGVQSGRVSSYPARLIDVAPTILQLMGIPYGKMQGLPLADAMKYSSGPAIHRQQEKSKGLMPVVHALRRESKLELAAGE